MTETKEQKLEQLAAEVLRLSRNQLLVNLRFLDAALSRLEPIPVPEITFATDGKYLAYDPRHLLRCYRTDRRVPVRNVLHIMLHCIYRHMFVHTLVDHVAWDLACDIAVEACITGLGFQAAESPREVQQKAVCDALQEEIGQLTAEKIYRYYLDRKLSPVKMADLRGLFYADDHVLWYLSEEEKDRMLGLAQQPGGGESSGDGEDGGAGGGQAVEVEVTVSVSAAGGGDENSGTAAAPVGLCSEEDWKSVSERIQMDMETFSQKQGRDPGAMLQNLREVNREKYDYTEFLKKFAVRGEVMKINDDEFDYIFYTYGLRLYENMPLIEPLEYKEVKRIREFVIAIDTSGSTSGELVQRFVQKTYNILQSTESFFSKINLHIIQCDAAIQEDVKITDQDEFDKYLKTMTIRGLGGTDFRPVFTYVEQLRERKEFRNLKGLIYFTDGYGTFPEKKPEYETAFVFLEEGYEQPEVPAWAIRLVLREDEI